MRMINRYHERVLVELVAAGHGVLDTSGRVCAGPLKAPIAADPIAWLVLVSNGLVAGENGMIMPTEEGRARAGEAGGARTREAS